MYIKVLKFFPAAKHTDSFLTHSHLDPRFMRSLHHCGNIKSRVSVMCLYSIPGIYTHVCT